MRPLRRYPAGGVFYRVIPWEVRKETTMSEELTKPNTPVDGDQDYEPEPHEGEVLDLPSINGKNVGTND